MAKRIAVVTGANKGIGFEIARQLCEREYRVLLACRSVDLGRSAAEALHALGHHDVEVYHLDISDRTSILQFYENVAREHDHIDVLVNNAAIAYKNADPTPFRDQARPTVHTNYFGTVWTTEAMLPLLKKSADPRIVNMASFTGMLKIIKSQEIRDAFTASDLTIDKLHSLMEWFVGAVEEGRHADEGWPNTCYGTSKLGVIVYTQLLAKQEPGIMVNCCCPGHCKTDMSSHSGDKTATEGAHVPVMLATKEHHKVTGRFYNVDGDITAKWFEV